MDRFTTSDIPMTSKIPLGWNRELKFDWTIEHFEGAYCVFQNDCELDCEYRSGHIKIVGGRFTDSAKPFEFSAIKNGNLEKLIDMKLVDIEADPRFQRLALEAWENS